ncbi:sulfite exporter TauE/SafE family protein [Candidatus Nomurabacteria bacterium]|nr:MAG: sulfite exporter TauE/SafE family protein [Candidatus Nomurabacteria bacterium]
MTILTDFLSEYLFVYIWLIATTFINIVVQTSGSMIINPVTAFFTDPQRAIGIGAFIFFFSGIHRVYLFRKEAFTEKRNLDIVKALMPFSIIGAILGGTLISYMSAKLLAAVVVIASIYFIYKTLRHVSTDQTPIESVHRAKLSMVALFSGFLQGGGLPGADIRNNYLRTVVSEVSVRAIGSTLGLSVFFVTGIIILFHNHLNARDLILVVTVIPFLLLAQHYGKKILNKLPDKSAKVLSVSLSLIGIILLTYKYFL